MPVPNSFANVTTSIPLSQLDANFNTPITLGNTAIQLGNTVTTLNNMTFANATITSGNVTLTNVSVTTANVTTANITTAIIATANVATANVTTSQILNYGTANQVQYLDANKALIGSANLTFNGTTLTVNSVGVGRGAGNVATNTAVGASALAANTTGANNTAVGYQAAGLTTSSNVTAFGYQAMYGANWATPAQSTAVGYRALYNGGGNNDTAVGYEALASTTSASGSNCAFGKSALTATTTGTNNTGLGTLSLAANTTGIQNTALGALALQANTTASNNTAVGFQAGYTQTTTASDQVFLGYRAGYSSTSGYNVMVGSQAGYNSTGAGNTFVGGNSSSGFGAGYAMTTGVQNTILGGFSGNQNGLDIRAGNNYAVISDGAGVPLISSSQNRTIALEGAVPNTGTGITFPVAVNPSSNANTLDDYEEGVFEPIALGSGTAGTGTYTLQAGRYTKIGRVCFFQFTIGWSNLTGATGDLNLGGLPFTSLGADGEVVAGQSAATVGYVSGLSFTNQPNLYIPLNNTILVFTQTTTGGVVSGIPIDTAVSEIIVNGHYIVA